MIKRIFKRLFIETTTTVTAIIRDEAFKFWLRRRATRYAIWTR